ncbi:HD-GYP domain-containing protein [Shewanella acanthi]|uniref:HD-GYP domain-containing protein n=1 Tax=Shewanella acanthi TaxID=2864212 RepID=UPI001C6608D2|nr:two-component system response regulator [Shewanella acanthi]QYJ80153.1 two-component system response regulator [Shewanella acanthi]
MTLSNDPRTVLIVDDRSENIDILRAVLQPHYRVKAAINGQSALKIAAKIPSPDLILLDVMMPEMDGFEVINVLKQDPKTANIPVIFVTASGDIADEQRGFELGAIDYIPKPISPPIVLARVRTHLALYDQNRELEEKVRERTQNLTETRLEIIKRLGRAAEFKDNETGMHVIRMSHYSSILAEALGMPKEWCQRLEEAAPMHDIGKIGIPDRILLKPGKLDSEEWEIMKQHTLYGAEILGNHSSDLLGMAKLIAASHHEKWDGSGYPFGLKGQDIPLEARIVALADVFDALTTERPYKSAWTVEQALDYITEQSGKHFDPDLVELFKRIVPQILQVKAKFAET